MDKDILHRVGNGGHCGCETVSREVLPQVEIPEKWTQEPPCFAITIWCAIKIAHQSYCEPQKTPPDRPHGRPVEDSLWKRESHQWKKSLKKKLEYLFVLVLVRLSIFTYVCRYCAALYVNRTFVSSPESRKSLIPNHLTNLPLVPHICVRELDQHYSRKWLDWHQAVAWTNTDVLSIVLLGTNLSEIWIQTSSFSFIKIQLKMPSAKWQPFLS